MTTLHLLEPLIRLSLGSLASIAFTSSYENSSFAGNQPSLLKSILDILGEVIEADLFKDQAIEEIKDYCNDLREFLIF
jgi:hypothetical protein